MAYLDERLGMDTVADDLVCAYRLDGNGGAQRIYWKEVGSWQPGDERIWVHFDRFSEETQRWVKRESGVPEIVATALLANESRPSSLLLSQGSPNTSTLWGWSQLLVLLISSSTGAGLIQVPPFAHTK